MIGAAVENNSGVINDRVAHMEREATIVSADRNEGLEGGFSGVGWMCVCECTTWCVWEGDMHIQGAGPRDTG